MKKWFSCLLSSLLILSIFLLTNPVKVNAVDVTLTVRTISQTQMNTIQGYLKLNKVNWFSDYNYYMWYYGTEVILTLIPKNNTNQLIFANNQVDSTYYQDIDTWQLKFSCSTQSPCLQYHFNSSYAYSGLDIINTSSNVYDVTSSPIYYSNVSTYTYLSQVVPNYPNTGVVTSIAGASYGILTIPSNWTDDWGYTTPDTDYQQTRSLIDANWGMFNFLRDFLYQNFEWMFDVMDSVYFGIQDIKSALLLNLMVVFDDINNGMHGVGVDIGRMWKAISDPNSTEASFFKLIIKSTFSDMEDDLNATLNAVQSIPLIGDILALVIAINNLILKSGLALAQFVFNFVGDTITFMSFVFNTVIMNFVPSIISMIGNVDGLVAFLPSPLNSASSAILLIAGSLTTIGLVKGAIGVFKF